MNYYTADLHFGHENVIKFDNRPFADTNEMDRILIENWNFRVRKEDNVYIVGDFCYRSDRSAAYYLKKLNGHKFLIIGNHEKAILEDEEASAYFEEKDKMMFVKEGSERLVLCHFPLAEWNGYYRGAWHIYGHIHNRTEETFLFMRTKERALNAGCMINNYMPVTFEELKVNNEIFKKSGSYRTREM